MKPVTIYSTMMCPYCSAAKNLLSRKGVKYDEIDVTFAPGKRSDMTRRAGENGQCHRYSSAITTSVAAMNCMRLSMPGNLNQC